MTVKIVVGLCILATLVSVNVYGQYISMEEAMLMQNGISGTGLTRIKAQNELGENYYKTYYRIQLQPEVNLGKIGFGLDLVLLYNPDDDEIRTEDGEEWNSFSDYLRAIRYIRYGHKNPKEPIYALYGALDYAVIGHGTIMEGYSNYDRRGLCLDLNISEGMYGIETVLNNFADPTVFGGRLHVRPLQKTGIPIIGKLTFGTTYITDIDPEPNSEEKVDPLVAFGVDVGMPIIEHNLLLLQLYNDLMFLRYKEETRKGNATGVGLGLAGGIRFKIEYRQFEENFRPTIFNYTYEYEKTQEEGLQFNEKALKGIYSQLTYSLMNKLFLLGTYEDYNETEPNVQVLLTERGLIDKISLTSIYTKEQIEDFEDIFDLDEKSLLILRIGYEVFKPFEIAVVREWRFRETDDEKGFETISKTSFEVGINIRY